MANKGSKPTPPPATGTPPEDDTPPEDGTPPPADGEATPEADETGAVATPSSPPPSSPPPPKAGRGKVKPVETELPLAFVQDTPTGFVARPHPQRHLTTIPGDLVLTNWFGHVEGKPCEVAYGTPLSALPDEVADAIVNTRRQPIGPLPARVPPNPLQP